MENGKFIISLDFELHWGAAEKWDLRYTKDYFDTTRKGIPDILDLFKKYEIHATWATVGFLFAKNKKQLLEFCPAERPNYKNKLLSYYHLIDNNEIGNNEEDDPYHYATSLISEILTTPNQELATHTFAHYYCNEDGQTNTQFDLDLKSAQEISKENFGITLKSLVFPRNQFNAEYAGIAYNNGIQVVRSNPDVWFWKTSSKFIPIVRAFDTLVPVSKSLTFSGSFKESNSVVELPASRFLRPYRLKEKLIQNLKMNRILSEMSYSAQHNRIYHLWWHPENFGYSLNENLYYLELILKHYRDLNSEHGFESLSMIEVVK